MITTILILLIVISAVIYAYVNRTDLMQTVKSSYGGESNKPTPKFYKTLIITVILILVSLFQPFALDRVDAGHVGIKVKLVGDARGVSRYEYRTGWVIYNTWTENLYEFPTFQQHIDYEEQVIITRGGFQTTIKPSFNYNLIAGQIGDMFQNLRRPLKQVEQEWLMNAIVSSVNDVANKWTVDEIFNNRETFEAAIITEVKKRTGRWFLVSQLRTNINPPEALKQSILAKTKAIQDVQVAENQKKVAEADAQRKIAIAKGDSAEAVISASGLAVAMKLKQQQLTPLYVEYIKWSNWNGALPTTMLGNQPLMLQR